MLVLTYGARIRPKDVPAHIYEHANPGRLLPVAPVRDGGEGERGVAEREFLYRYLLELKRDVAEIKDLLEDLPFRGQLIAEIPVQTSVELVEEVPGPAGAGAEPVGGLPFRLGISLEEVEKEAIRLTLAGVRGNRRKAASLLQIGERTLYRKIKQYDLG